MSDAPAPRSLAELRAFQPVEGFIYFVRGFTVPALPGQRGSDFGPGLYACRFAGPADVERAAEWAAHRADQCQKRFEIDAIPRVELKQISEAAFEMLTHKDLNPDGQLDSAEWQRTVRWYKPDDAAEGGPFSDYDV